MTDGSPAAPPALKFSIDDGIAVVTLDRPSKMNSLNPELVCRLADAWDAIAGGPAVRVAIVTGAGDRAFCTGADLGRLIPLFTRARPADDEWDERLLADRGPEWRPAAPQQTRSDAENVGLVAVAGS